MKMSIFIIAAVSVLTFGACTVRIIDNKEAAGKMVEKTIDVKDFNKLQLDTYADVVYTVSDTFSVRIKVYPVWLYIHHSVTLLQDKNIARDLRACICLKGVVWQTDST